MNKLERLLNLVAALLDTEAPLAATTLRRRIDGYPSADASFHRAFERDKDDLRKMGIPLRVEPVPGVDPPVDGYRIDRDEYGGDVPDLEPDELAALHLATNLVRMEGTDSTEALRRLGGVVGEGTVAPVAAIASEPNVVTLFDAIHRRHVVSFTYRDTDRRVQPWGLSFRRGHWYLMGWDEGRDDERMFRVDRITGDVHADPDAAFERRRAARNPDLPGWLLGDGEPVETRLLVDADQAVWATHHLGADAICDERADGSVEFAVMVRDRAAFRSFVLSFLDHAELLAPEDMRAELVAWLEDIAA